MDSGKENSMESSVRPSPGLMVIIVFCLTVLLGIGGTSAFALWEQSAHANSDQGGSASPAP